MFEKVNPAHPDKIADRIAGALVDLAYKSERNPRIAVEVLIGHGTCHIIAETSVQLSIDDVTAAVHRIAGFLNVDYSEVPQDVHLSRNQSGAIRCGDNGIFKGVPVTAEQKELVRVATDIYNAYPLMASTSSTTAGSSSARATPMLTISVKSIPSQKSIRSVTGLVARMWILVLLTASWAAIWLIP